MQPVTVWKLRTRVLHFDRMPALMGIVNVTPDSFSDGGRFYDQAVAVGHALQLAQQGAAILDIGGESTRPYAKPVSQADELARVIPVIREVCQSTAYRNSDAVVSIDTTKPAVAQAAIEAGAEIINDISGLENPAMLEVARTSGAGVCAMHMQGTPQTMQDDPQYDDVVGEIHAYLAARRDALLAAGLTLEKICLDPGIGFGKTHEHNIELARSCHRFLDLGCPLLVGHSRKGFIGKLIQDKEAERSSGSVGVSLALAMQGVQVLRVHDVAATRHALQTFFACCNFPPDGVN